MDWEWLYNTSNAMYFYSYLSILYISIHICIVYISFRLWLCNPSCMYLFMDSNTPLKWSFSFFSVHLMNWKQKSYVCIFLFIQMSKAMSIYHFGSIFFSSLFFKQETLNIRAIFHFRKYLFASLLLYIHINHHVHVNIN